MLNKICAVEKLLLNIGASVKWQEAIQEGGKLAGRYAEPNRAERWSREVGSTLGALFFVMPMSCDEGRRAYERALATSLWSR